LLAAMRTLQTVATESATLWPTFASERPALPVGSPAIVERSLALAATLGLGTIAWTLWAQREVTTPMLALQRFGDLDARVVFRSDEVQVQLPLGQRFFDLQKTGFLDDVTDVPWYGGRRLRFVRG
jgi:hypothetical protein